jgi:hypothetical protein
LTLRRTSLPQAFHEIINRGIAAVKVCAVRGAGDFDGDSQGRMKPKRRANVRAEWT